MERLVAILDRYHCGMRILFKDGDMFLQLDWDKNRLETDLRSFVSKFKKEKSLFGMKFTINTWTSMDNIYPEDITVDPEAFKNHYEDIASIYSLVVEMQQKVRIWG